MDNRAEVSAWRTAPELVHLLDSLGEERALPALGEVLDALPVGVMLIDGRHDDLPILYLNSRAEAFAAGGRKAALGASALRVLAASNQVVQAIREVRGSGGRRQVRYRCAPGQLCDFEATAIADGSGHAQKVVATWHAFRDRGHEWERLDAARQLAALAAEQVTLLLPGVEALIALVPAQRQDQLTVASATPDWRDRLSGRSFDLEEASGEDPPALRRLLPGMTAIRTLTLGTGQALPDGRRTLGLVAFFTSRDAQFSETEKLAMDELAARLSGAMHTSELLESSEGSADRLYAAVDAALEVGGSLEPAKVMEWMLKRAADEADADLVMLMRREEDELVPEAGFDRDRPGDDPAERISLSQEPASRRALELGQPVLRSPEPLAGGGSSRLRDLRHTARVPLVIEGEPAALMLLGRRRGGPFTRDDAAMLGVLARHAAVAIRNARLYERAQSTARRLQVGVDVALDVAARLEPEEVVERILSRALDAVEAERAMLGRMEDGLRATILGSVDRMGDPAPLGMTLSLESQEPAVQAITSRRPAQGRIDFEQIGMRPLRWTLVIPLVVGGELVALLAVGRDRRQFDEDEVAVLQQLGAVAALAFRNARLFGSLREASRVRSQFLNMAAHELRTPLSVIGGYVSMLADGSLGRPPPTWEAPLVVLLEKTSELAHLIDDILLAGRLEGGLARTAGVSMDLSKAVKEAAQRASARAELLVAELRVEIPDGAVKAWGDPDQVGRILDNLINNAFNYSPAPPRVSIRLELEPGFLVVRVEDHGRGIAPEHRERVFQQFYRVDDPADGYPPGTGLGLFISRALAERSGGSLDLEWSEPGAGSRFALRLRRPEES